MDEHDLILDELLTKSQELGLPWDINKALWEIENDRADRQHHRQVD